MIDMTRQRVSAISESWRNSVVNLRQPRSITPVRDRLTDPAGALFSVLASEVSASERPDILKDPRPADRAETTTELEAAAYAELLDRLREPDLPPHRPDTDTGFGGMAQSGTQIPSD